MPPESTLKDYLPPPPPAPTPVRQLSMQRARIQQYYVQCKIEIKVKT